MAAANLSHSSFLAGFLQHLAAALALLQVSLLVDTVLAEPVRIGAIASLSGPAGEQGKNWLQGAQLAVEEVNGKGTRAVLFVEDDQTQAGQAVSAFHKLVSAHQVSGILGGTWDFLGESLYPLAARARIPFITPTNPPEVLSEAALNNPWVFTSAMSLRQVELAARSFLIHKQVRRAAILVPSLPFGTVQADLIERLARELSIEVTQRIEFSPEGNFQDSVRNAASRFRRQAPDLIFAVVDYSILDMLTAEFERIQYMPTILTTQHLDAALALSKSRQQYRSCYAIYPSSLQNQAFTDAFSARFGAAPRVYAAEGYAATRFLIEALESKVDFAQPSVQFTRAGIIGEFSIPPRYLRAISEGTAQIMTSRNGVFEPYQVN